MGAKDTVETLNLDHWSWNYFYCLRWIKVYRNFDSVFIYFLLSSNSRFTLHMFPGKTFEDRKHQQIFECCKTAKFHFRSLRQMSRGGGQINYREEEKKILDSILGKDVYDNRIRPSGLNGTGDSHQDNLNCLWERKGLKINWKWGVLKLADIYKMQGRKLELSWPMGLYQRWRAALFPDNRLQRFFEQTKISKLVKWPVFYLG